MRWVTAALLGASLALAAAEDRPQPWYQRCIVEDVHPGQERSVDAVRRLLAEVRRFDDRPKLARLLGRPGSASVDTWLWTVGAEAGDPAPDADVLALHFEHGMPVRYELIHASNARIVLTVAIP